jgi:hypothetical protein
MEHTRLEAMALTAALPIQARFFFLLIPRLAVGRCTPSRLAAYAIDLTASGSRRLGMWCWDRAVRRSARDEPMCDAVLDLCIRGGHHEAAEELANSFYDTSGLSPAAAVKLAGNLVLTGGYGPALKVYDRLLQHCGDDLACRSPAPNWDAGFGAPELRRLLSAQVSGDLGDSVNLDLGFGRLCFSFYAFDTSARLFERAAARAEPGARQSIARAYALLRCDRAQDIPEDIEALVGTPAAASLEPDWQMLLASVLFNRGAVAAATAAVEEALRARFGDHAEFQRIRADCRHIVACLARMPAAIKFREDENTDAPSGDTGLRKVFVCGSGWSGSGALYDALADYDGLAEAPDTPIDRYMNVGTDNEMMFVQGPAALGRLWRRSKQEGTLSRTDLWDTLRLHVTGGGAIGYSEHKSARVASNLLERFGGRYTSVFRCAFEGLAALPKAPRLSELRSILTDATEALSAMFIQTPAGRGDCECVVYNNAIFGTNIDMLEIFLNARAAVVVRDPLDQFADRRANDLKHWMTPSRFVPLYRSAREAFHARKEQLVSAVAREVREVPFEKFVLDDTYRTDVIEWLLESQHLSRARSQFEAERSARNIGIHVRLLAPHEREVLERELQRWRPRS